MAILNSIKMRSFNSVAAGTTATLEVPVGLTYHTIYLVYGGTTFTPTLMDGIRVKINAQEVMNFGSGADLNTMNQYMGRADATTKKVLAIDFDRYGLLARAGRESTALRTGMPHPTNPAIVHAQTVTIEVDINAGASAPTLEAYAVISPAQPPALFRHVRRQTYQASAAGIVQLDNIPKGHKIDQVYVSHGGILTNMKLELDRTVFYDRTPELSDAIQKDGIRVPQTNIMTIDWSETGYSDDALATRYKNGQLVGDLNIDATVSGSGSLVTTFNTLGPLGA